jgi:predicted Zn finger-like uncharacterized protein
VPLTTRCERCGHLFVVYAQQLRADRGRVTCPRCAVRINAVAGLLDEQASSGASTAPRGRTPTPARTASAPTRGLGLVQAGAPTPMRRGLRPEATVRRTSVVARIGWGLTSLVLLLLLIGQGIWWWRGDLLHSPRVVEVGNAWCASLGCELPLVRLPGALTLEETSLTPGPDGGALILNLRIENRGPLPQPAPVIEVELYDQSGDLAAVRRFTPEDYAATDATGGHRRALHPGETRALALALAPPRTDASGFMVRLQ